MNKEDKTIYKIPELGLTGTKEELNKFCEQMCISKVWGVAITNKDLTEVVGHISQDYMPGDDIFETRLKAKAEKQSMCKKQQTIKEITAAATALIEKYNSVIQDREWVAMQAVARVNGFTYRGPWIAQEIQALASVIETTNAIEGKKCNDLES